MKKRKGFTLVELLVTIAIILVLSTIAIVAYSSSIKKTNLSNDEALVRVLNDYIKAYDVNNPVRNTSQAREVLFPEGIKLETLKTASKNYRFGYDIVKKEFCLIDDNWKTDFDGEKANIYAFVENVDQLAKAKELGYAAYMQEEFFGEEKDVEFTTDMAVDTGVNEIKVFNYINVDEANKHNIVLVVYAEALNIDAPYDTITHYGQIETALDITRIAADTYIEEGTIRGNVFVEDGHFVVGENGEATYILVTGPNVKLDGITDDNYVVVFGGYDVLINSDSEYTTYKNYKEGAEDLSGSHIIYMVNKNGSFKSYDEKDPTMILAHKFAGLGTKEHPFLLQSAEDYIRLQDVLRENYDVEFPETWFKQTEDVILKQPVDIDPENKFHIDTDGHTITTPEDNFGDLVIFEEDGKEKDKRENIIIDPAPVDPKDDDDDKKKDSDHTHTYEFYDIRRHKCTTCGDYDYHAVDGVCKCGLISIKSLSLIDKSGTADKKTIYRLTKNHTLDAKTIDENYLDIYLSAKETKLNDTLKISGSNITIYGDNGSFEMADGSDKTCLEISGKNVTLIDVIIKQGLKVKPGAKVILEGENTQVLGDLDVDPNAELIIKDGIFKDDPYNYLDDKKNKNARQTDYNRWEVVDSDEYIYPVLAIGTKNKEYRTVAAAFAEGKTNLILQDKAYYKGTIDNAVTFGYSYEKIQKIKNYPTTVISLIMHEKGSIIKDGVYNVKVDCIRDAKIDCAMTKSIYFKYSENTSAELHNALADSKNYHVTQVTYNQANYYTVCHKAVSVYYGTYSNSYMTFNEAYQDALKNAGTKAVTITLYHDVTFAGNIDKDYKVNSYNDKEYVLQMTYGTNIVSKGHYDVKVTNRENTKFIIGGTYKFNPSYGVDVSNYYYSTIDPWTVSHGVAAHENFAYGTFEEAYEVAKKSANKVITLLEDATYTKAKFNYDATVKGNYKLTFTNSNVVISRGVFDVKTVFKGTRNLAGGKFLTSKNTYTKNNCLGECYTKANGDYTIVINTLLRDSFFESLASYVKECNTFEEAYAAAKTGGIRANKHIVVLYNVPCNVSISKDVIISDNYRDTEINYTVDVQGENTKFTNGLYLVHLTSEEGRKPIQYGRFYDDPRALVADGYKAEQPCWLQYVNSTKGWSVGDSNYVLHWTDEKGEDHVKGYDSFTNVYNAVPVGSTGYMIIVNVDANVDINLDKDITYVNGGTGTGSSDIYATSLNVKSGKQISNGTFDIFVDVEGVNITHGLFNHFYNSKTFDAQLGSTSAYEIEFKEGDLYYNVRSAVARVNGKGYLTFDKAYAAANAGDTIELLTDCTGEYKYTGNIDKDVTVNGNYTLAIDGEIKSGTFNCGISVNDKSISGGRFLYDVNSKSLKSGYAIAARNDGYKYVGEIVAYIGSTPYISFDEAYNAAVGGKDTIKLVKNQTTSTVISKYITIATENNSTLTVQSTVSKGVFNVKVIFAGDYELVGDNTDYNPKFNKNYNKQSDLANAIGQLYSVTTSGDYYAIVYSKITMSNKGYMNFNTPYNNYSGAMVVRSTVDSTVVVEKNIEVSINSGKKLTVAGIKAGTYEGDGALVVNGDITAGTFTNKGGLTVNNGKISGGTFSYDVSNYLAYGYYQDDNGQVQLGKAVLNNKVYNSFTDAYKAASDESVIDLLQDAKCGEVMEKNITVYSSRNAILTSKLSITNGTYNLRVDYEQKDNSSVQGGKFLISASTNAGWKNYVHSEYIYEASGNYYVVGKVVAEIYSTDAEGKKVACKCRFVTMDKALDTYTGVNEVIYISSDVTINRTIDKNVLIDGSYEKDTKIIGITWSSSTKYRTITLNGDISNGVYYANVNFGSSAKVTGGYFLESVPSTNVEDGYCCYVDSQWNVYTVSAHDYAISTTAQARTCQTDEITRHTCSHCSAYWEETTATKYNHNYVFTKFNWTASYGSAQAVYTCDRGCQQSETHDATVVSNTTAATCTTNGTASHTASYDGHYETKSETLSSLGHAWGEQVSSSYVADGKAVSCTSNGIYYKSCTRSGCGVTRYSVDTNDAQKYAVDNFVKKGKEGIFVDVYKFVFVEDALGHTIAGSAQDGADAKTGPTCQANGVYYYHCSRCSSKLDQTYTLNNQLDHNYTYESITWNNYSAVANYRCQNGCNGLQTHNATVTSDITKTATCTALGTRTYTATYDGHSSTKNQDVAMIAHTLSGTTRVNATCTSDGHIAYWTCSKCTQLFKDANGTTSCTSKETVIKATGHNYQSSDWTWGNNYTTCSATVTCANSGCGDRTNKNATVTSSTTQATCLAAGKTVYTATFNNQTVKTKEIAISQKSHNYTYQSITWTNYTAVANYKCQNGCNNVSTYTCNVTNTVTKDATCTEDGNRRYTASYSGNVSTKDQTISKLGHNYVKKNFGNYRCSRCNGWSFTGR